MFDGLLSFESLIALLTLTGLEIVLGIDNIVFIAILTGKLPPSSRTKARRVGLSIAMLARIGLLLTITWVMRLQTDLFSIRGHGFSGHDLILIGGGLFLIAKATFEIHDKMEGPLPAKSARGAATTFAKVITQIVLIDLIFSLDSVITAVGMARQVPIMVAAIVIAVVIMLVFASSVSHFIERHPTMKVLALAFLVLIGVTLFAGGFGKHIEKGYIYFAMAFSLGVEFVNIRVRRSHDPVKLHHQPHLEDEPAKGA